MDISAFGHPKLGYGHLIGLAESENILHNYWGIHESPESKRRMKTFRFLTTLLLTFNLHLALAQTPRTAEDYNNRGLERQSKGDLDGAIEETAKQSP